MMDAQINNSDHDRAVNLVFETANRLGYGAYKEKGGKGWRADVLVNTDTKNIAFEVQLCRQSLNKTWDRQNRYLKSGIIGCWLILKPFKKFKDENRDLPLFYISTHHNEFFVSLIDKRKEVPLADFVKAFILRNIKFCTQAKTSKTQQITINFIEVKCWKCKALNHVYYVENPYSTRCNIKLSEEECMWSDQKLVFKPEILTAVKQILNSPNGKGIKMGNIKNRFSKTVSDSYLSFGCHKCDSIFGDWHVMEEELDYRNGFVSPISITTIVMAKSQIIRSLNHWCYPENNEFCHS